jgi:alkylation response protein AidB-like acyl-CoA dehydrogenase
MIRETNLFIRPAPWGIGPGPACVHSIDAALSAADMWLVLTPDRVGYREERARMQALREILERARVDPGEADLQSAKLAIKGMVRFARTREQRRATSRPPLRYGYAGTH